MGLAESDGQLQVLLLLETQPPQPLLLFALALLLGPLQLLVLTSKLEQAERKTLELKVKRGAIRREVTAGGSDAPSRRWMQIFKQFNFI